MLLLSALIACDSNDNETAGPTCDVTYSVSIHEGDIDVPGNAPVVVTLSEADDTASITSAVAGTTVTSPDGLTLTWTPDAPLDPVTDVTVDIATCAGGTSIHYTTADIGGPIDSIVDLTATGFLVDLATGTVVKPTSGDALFTMLSSAGTSLVLGITEASQSALDFRLAMAAEGAQDLCSRTLDLPGGTLDRGWFGFGPAPAVFYVYDNTVHLEDLAFGGAIRVDGSGIDAAWVRGWVGVEPLANTYAEGDIDEACRFFSNLGAPCEPCPQSDGQCLALEVTGLSGTSIGTPVASVDVACTE